jgi:hypothetical protein
VSFAAYFLALLGFLIVWPWLLIVTFHETAVLVFGGRPPPEDPPNDTP